MNRLSFFIPLVIFLLFAAVAGYMLTQPKQETVESAMIGRPLPAFDLPGATDDAPRLASAYFVDGTPRLLNIWASWCVPCVAEAPQLEALRRAGAPIVGIAIRDTPEDIARFTQRYGNPYVRIARDDISAVQQAIGSSGVPETFVIDGKGVIRHQHIGDIRPDDVPELLQQLEDAR